MHWSRSSLSFCSQLKWAHKMLLETWEKVVLLWNVVEYPRISFHESRADISKTKKWKRNKQMSIFLCSPRRVSLMVLPSGVDVWILVSIRHNVPKRSSIHSLLFLGLVLLYFFGNSSGNFFGSVSSPSLGFSEQGIVFASLKWPFPTVQLRLRMAFCFAWMTEPLASSNSLCLICAILMRLWSLQSCPVLSFMHSFPLSYLPDVLLLHKSRCPQSTCVRVSNAHNLMQRWNIGLCLISPFVDMSDSIHEMLL